MVLPCLFLLLSCKGYWEITFVDFSYWQWLGKSPIRYYLTKAKRTRSEAQCPPPSTQTPVSRSPLSPVSRGLPSGAVSHLPSSILGPYHARGNLNFQSAKDSHKSKNTEVFFPSLAVYIFLGLISLPAFITLPGLMLAYLWSCLSSCLKLRGPTILPGDVSNSNCPPP